jgi:Holliday junction DNA helicase RuvA
MIGKLRGEIDSLQEDKAIIDVNGVGYVVFISNKTAQFLSGIKNSPNQEKKQVSLIIETVVKEDAIDLYGFATEIERIWFLELTKVQGVGAKMGLKILAFFTIDDLAKALLAGDVKAFNKISGIGPKLAQRITTELKTSPKKLGISVSFEEISADGSAFAANEITDDALSALENLGYKKAEAVKILGQILKQQPEITLENLITASLRELSKRKF